MSSPSIVQPPTNPWNKPSTSAASTPRSPTIQEILDEEMARQLHELELNETAKLYLTTPSPSTNSTIETTDTTTEELVAFESDGEFPSVEDDEPDYEDYDDADLADDLYLSKSQRSRGGGGRRGRGDAMGPTNIRLIGSFDDRTRWVLGRLAGRGLLNAVTRCLHSSASAQVHVGTNDLDVDGVDEKVHKVYAVKILKCVSTDRPQKVAADDVKFHSRPMDEEMLWMSIRRQVKIRMNREYAAQMRAIAAGVRAPKPLCAWEHVMVMEFVGNEATAAPCLCDVILRQGQLAQAFVDLVVAARAMYKQAKVVHGGLSEYSVLYHTEACWITDFSGAVDIVHPEHQELLDHDVDFLFSFFQQRGMPKASKHDVGLLNKSAIRELITEGSPARVLGAFPWIKPYLYKKK